MLTISLAQPEDYELLCQCDQLATTGSALIRLERREEIAHALIDRSCYIAKQASSPVGYIIFSRSFFKHAFISLLAVHPAHRRQGIGSHLVRYVESLCHSEKLFTSTNQSNVSMQKLCENLGFLPCGHIEQLDDNDPELFYYKRL
jgi:ribosomal protein S18 acetylase RimI-like enzyme